jgi:hypothetical protein
VGSILRRVKSKTTQLIFAASPFHAEAESRDNVSNWIYVFTRDPRNVVSVSWHHRIPAKYVGLLQNGHIIIILEIKCALNKNH